MRKVLCLAGVLAGLLSGAPLAPAQERPDPPADEVAVWFDALERHAPGVNDPPIRTILWLSPRGFGRVTERILALRRIQSAESHNRLVHRGALMHLDAAMLAVSSLSLNGGRTIGTARARDRVILTTDGGYSGVDSVSEHWDWGRRLIDLTLPRPGDDRSARLWYVASSAFLANRSRLADLTPHLDKARKLFPTDPDILFVSGCYFDMIASPRVSPLLESKALPFEHRVNAPSASESLRMAEDYFRRAAAARPDFVAARLRRGRALNRLGRYEDARQEFRAIDGLPGDQWTKYLTALFDGESLEALGDAAPAKARYEQAAREFPSAQAPYLALSRLARNRGDRAAALAAVEHVFTSASGEEMTDPWWTYYHLVVRDATEKLELLRQPFLKSAAPVGKD